MGRDLLCILDSEEDVRNYIPNAEKIKELDGLLLHITARGKETDSVSRSFAPKLNVLEDAVRDIVTLHRTGRISWVKKAL